MWDLVTAGCAACFGLAAGSFLNVVLYRVPRGRSLLQPPSCCPHCTRRLGAAELIPVVSYLAQGGRCAGCRAPIGVTYPLVEAFCGLAAAAASYVAGGWGAALVLALLLLGALVWGQRRRAGLRHRPGTRGSVTRREV